MPFALPEYEVAAQHQSWRALSALAVARSDLLQLVTIETVEEIPTAVVTAKDGRTLELPSEPVSFKFGLSLEAVLAGDLSDFLAELDQAAAVKSEAMERGMLETLSDVTSFVGNLTKTSGGPLSLDDLTNAMASMEIDFSPDGRPLNLSLVLHPDDAAKALPPTPDQLARHEEMIAHKFAEWKAKQRTRRMRRADQGQDA